MTVYFVFIATIIIEYLLVFRLLKLKKANKVYCLIVFVEYILLTGLRGYNIGADTGVYLFYLDLNKGISFFNIFGKLDSFEIGYSVFTKFCSYLNMTKTGFLFLVGFITSAPFFFWVYKCSINPLISFVAFMTFQPMFLCWGMFRQAIAISIFFLSIPFIVKRKIVPYLLLVLFGLTFHFSILLLLPFYWVYRIKISYILLIIIPLVTFLSIMFSNQLSHFLASALGYSQYIGSQYDVQQTTGTYMYVVVLLLMTEFVVASYIYSNQDNNDELIKLFLWGMIVYCFVQPFVYSFALFNRITASLTFFVPFCLPILGDFFKSKTDRNVTKVVFSFFLIGFCVYQLSINKYVSNYLFFWESDFIYIPA